MTDSVFGDVIHAYTRKQAIEDGVLVDLMQDETAGAVREAGFKFPVAMTAAAFDLAVWPIDNEKADEWLHSKCQDLQGRLWDVLWMLKLRIRAMMNGPSMDCGRCSFTLKVVNWKTKRGNIVTLKSLCGPGDDGEPVITIMLPDED